MSVNKATRAEIFREWAQGLSTEQLRHKLADMPYEVRQYRDEECRAVEAELQTR